MNNPLRYAGNTFYQSSFDQATEQTTVLQVVANPGWMAPYVACMLVATGMLAHFGISLVRFSRRRADEAARLASAHQPVGKRRGRRRFAQKTTPWTAFAKWFPALVVVVFAMYVAGKARMPRSTPSEMQIYEFAKLPLAYQGRIKPYDTVARNALQILSGRQEVIVEQDTGRTKLPAIRWLLDTISGAPAAGDHRCFPHRKPGVVGYARLEAARGFVPLFPERFPRQAGRTAKTDRVWPMRSPPANARRIRRRYFGWQGS